eukprot:2574665-Amphidinium_carterae.1
MPERQVAIISNRTLALIQLTTYGHVLMGICQAFCKEEANMEQLRKAGCFDCPALLFVVQV